MKAKELDTIITQILEEEVKKVITEQVDFPTEDETSSTPTDSVTKLQTLSGLIDKISDIQNIDDVDFGVVINIGGVSEEDLISTYGGESIEDAEQNLMQGLHNDLEDAGLGTNFDIDVESEGQEGNYNFIIKIRTAENDLLGDNDMEDNEKLDQNMDNEISTDEQEGITDEKKEILLGDKEIEETEIDEKEKKWIQKAVNPEHKGYCTPMTKETCTPKRKALAKRFKKGISEGKVVITLNEEEMKELLTRIIKEASEPTMDATTRNALDKAGKQNADALKQVEDKIKKYLSFKGNDNPEFPNQIGQGEEKAARQNSKEQDEEVDINRGRGPQDLDYDTDGVDDNGEPGKKFQDRIEKALTGDSTMGNSQDAVGIVKTDTGKKILDSMKKRRESLRKEPIYPKEAVPVDTKPEPKLGRPVNEDEEKKKAQINEEIEKMRKLATYNKKTQ